MAIQQWHWLAERYPYVVLHAFVVMPNHVHAIIEIDHYLVGTDGDQSEKRPVDETASHTFQSHNIKLISELMGAYKITTFKLIRQAGLVNFAWQRSFHDHIIRHERAYEHIKNYIQNTSAFLNDDVFYQESPSADRSRPVRRRAWTMKQKVEALINLNYSTS
ncbi:transposase [Pontibacter oryzae]|uniref:transposase n=1 Tax=Pontibacter oryzae TaxID=2304593 RepID=UPI0018F3618F|nr:transposase [Pontibacter oryzae]